MVMHAAHDLGKPEGPVHHEEMPVRLEQCFRRRHHILKRTENLVPCYGLRIRGIYDPVVSLKIGRITGYTIKRGTGKNPACLFNISLNNGHSVFYAV